MQVAKGLNCLNKYLLYLFAKRRQGSRRAVARLYAAVVMVAAYATFDTRLGLLYRRSRAGRVTAAASVAGVPLPQPITPVYSWLYTLYCTGTALVPE
jgi:hypothetical protein